MPHAVGERAVHPVEGSAIAIDDLCDGLLGHEVAGHAVPCRSGVGAQCNRRMPRPLRTGVCPHAFTKSRPLVPFGWIGDLRRELLPENVETTVAVERSLLLNQLPALLGLVVQQHLQATLAGRVLERVVGAPELLDAVLPLSAHWAKRYCHSSPMAPSGEAGGPTSV